jgi:hypothetical protein
VLNRGDALSQVFQQSEDYAAFIPIVGESSVRLPLSLLAYPMPTIALTEAALVLLRRRHGVIAEKNPLRLPRGKGGERFA